MVSTNPARRHKTSNYALLKTAKRAAMGGTFGAALTAALIATGITIPDTANAQIRTAVERATGRAAVRSAERRAAAPRACRGIPQRCAGLRREQAAHRILASRYPNERIQRETYLRNRDGSLARDPATGEARRIDFVLFADGRVSRRFEVTSQHANKREQLAKELRIFERNADGSHRIGPVYVRDRATGDLVPVRPGASQVIRFN